jgi:hypothetical protein
MNSKQIIRFFSIVLICSFLQSCSNDTDYLEVNKELRKNIKQLIEQNEELQKRLEKNESVLYEMKISYNEDFDILKKDLELITKMVRNQNDTYITKEEAVNVAKTLNGDADDVIDWKVKFNENYDYDERNPSNPIYAVWVIEFLHTLGNKTIFYIDAITKEPINIAEIENNM